MTNARINEFKYEKINNADKYRFTFYVELDFSFPDINVGIGSAQKWPSKDDGHF